MVQMLLFGMMLLRLEAATCEEMLLRRVLRDGAAWQAHRGPPMADVAGAVPLLEGVLVRSLASVLTIGGRVAFLRVMVTSNPKRYL